MEIQATEMFHLGDVSLTCSFVGISIVSQSVLQLLLFFCMLSKVYINENSETRSFKAAVQATEMFCSPHPSFLEYLEMFRLQFCWHQCCLAKCLATVTLLLHVVTE